MNEIKKATAWIASVIIAQQANNMANGINNVFSTGPSTMDVGLVQSSGTTTITGSNTGVHAVGDVIVDQRKTINVPQNGFLKQTGINVITQLGVKVVGDGLQSSLSGFKDAGAGNIVYDSTKWMGASVKSIWNYPKPEFDKAVISFKEQFDDSRLNLHGNIYKLEDNLLTQIKSELYTSKGIRNPTPIQIDNWILFKELKEFNKAKKSEGLPKFTVKEFKQYKTIQYKEFMKKQNSGLEDWIDNDDTTEVNKDIPDDKVMDEMAQKIQELELKVAKKEKPILMTNPAKPSVIHSKRGILVPIVKAEEFITDPDIVVTSDNEEEEEEEEIQSDEIMKSEGISKDKVGNKPIFTMEKVFDNMVTENVDNLVSEKLPSDVKLEVKQDPSTGELRIKEVPKTDENANTNFREEIKEQVKEEMKELVEEMNVSVGGPSMTKRAKDAFIEALVESANKTLSMIGYSWTILRDNILLAISVCSFLWRYFKISVRYGDQIERCLHVNDALKWPFQALIARFGLSIGIHHIELAMGVLVNAFGLYTMPSFVNTIPIAATISYAMVHQWYTASKNPNYEEIRNNARGMIRACIAAGGLFLSSTFDMEGFMTFIFSHLTAIPQFGQLVMGAVIDVNAFTSLANSDSWTQQLAANIGPHATAHLCGLSAGYITTKYASSIISANTVATIFLLPNSFSVGVLMQSYFRFIFDTFIKTRSIAKITTKDPLTLLRVATILIDST